MTELTKQWRDGELNVLDILIQEIEEINNRKALSDEYLKENNAAVREEYDAVEDYEYGITFVMTDYALPYLKKLLQLKNLTKLPLNNLQVQYVNSLEQINRLTTALQNADNQYNDLRDECQEREKLNCEAKDIMQRQRAEINRLKEQLEVATKAIKSIQNEDIDGGLSMFCANILNKIKEKAGDE